MGKIFFYFNNNNKDRDERKEDGRENNNKNKRRKKEDNGREHFFELPQGYKYPFVSCSYEEFKQKYNKHIKKKLDNGDEVEFYAIWCICVYPAVMIKKQNGDVTELKQHSMEVYKKVNHGHEFISKDVEDMILLTQAAQELGICAEL